MSPAITDEEIARAIEKRKEAISGDSREVGLWALGEYGARGFAIYKGAGEGEAYYGLDDAPPDCPFSRGLERDAFIEQLWDPVARKVPKFVAALRSRTKHLIACHRTKTGPEETNRRGWFLGYGLDRGTSSSPRYRFMWGRQPFANPKLSKKAHKAGFTLPPSLGRFYNVHNGMGMSTCRTGGVEALLSAKNLEPRSSRPNLLEVFCDSGGVRECFLKGKDRLEGGTLWELFETRLIRYVTG